MGGAVFSYYTINSTTETMIQNLEQLKQEVEEENWDKARQTQQQLLSDWDRADRIYSYLVDHEQLHDLDIKLHRLTGQLEFEDPKHIIPDLNVSLDLVNNIRKEEKPRLENIF